MTTPTAVYTFYDHTFKILTVKKRICEGPHANDEFNDYIQNARH